MELTGSAYLFALAAVSITFSGFSALIMTFRQTVGSGLSRLDLLGGAGFRAVGISG